MKSVVVKFIKDNFTPPNKNTGNCRLGVKSRIEFIDLAKGVCIILVVLFHCGLFDGFPGVDALRMPLYFMLSGLFFKDYGGIYNLMEKKINKLLVPFISFFLLGLLAHWFHFGRFDYAVLLDPVYTNQMVNLPVWFLICLFWINLIYCVISVYVRPLLLKGFFVCFFGAVGYILSAYDIYLPYFLCSAFSALPFFFVGMMLRKLPLLYPNSYGVYELVAAVIILGVGLIYSVLFDNPHMKFRSNEFDGRPLEIYMLSISLVIGLLLLCKRMKWMPIVSYVGRYSIIVLGLHGVVMTILSYCDPTLNPKFSPILISVITLSICWLAIPFMIRYFPRFTAQKDLIHLPRRKPKVVAVEAPEAVEAIETVEEEKS